MKGKTKFTPAEASQIRKLIRQKLVASPREQKGIRNKIRSIGFYYSDFSPNKDGYTVEDFDYLIKTKQIEITDEGDKEIFPIINLQNPPIIVDHKQNIQIDEVDKELIINGNYYPASQVDVVIPKNKTGFYSFRLSGGKSLPPRYQFILDKRLHRILYIGKAEGQSLSKRLGQELRALGHGTFFRSIGAVLGFLPPKGSLLGMKNQNNYKFSSEDIIKIINWINDNLEISWIEYDGDFSLEAQIINKYTPLLNDAHNPFSLRELKEDKDKCRATARNL